MPSEVRSDAPAAEAAPQVGPGVTPEKQGSLSPTHIGPAPEWPSFEPPPPALHCSEAADRRSHASHWGSLVNMPGYFPGSLELL